MCSSDVRAMITRPDQKRVGSKGFKLASAAAVIVATVTGGTALAASCWGNLLPCIRMAPSAVSPETDRRRRQVLRRGAPSLAPGGTA